MKITPPVTQIALDFPTIEQAIEMAHIAVKAGIDWLEIGTPLIVYQGLAPIGAMVKAFPGYPVLADYKTMDSGGTNVELTAAQGGHIMTVCAGAPDETIKAAVAASKKTGVSVVVDTIGVKNQAQRVRQCAEFGVDMIYLHYGADERHKDPSRDCTPWIEEVMDAVSIPVGVATFDIESAVRAAKLGVDNYVIGFPLIGGDDPLGALTEYVKQVKANYKPR